MRLAGLLAVAILALILAFSVRAGMPAGAQSGPRFAIDANLDNGVCDPVDAAVTVGQNGTLKVAVCLLNAPAAPEAFTLHVSYDSAFMTAPEVPKTAGALDDNPDANAGLTTFGSQSLGTQWDCTTFGALDPVGDFDRIPGGDALMNCNANINNPDLKLTNGALAVITFQTGNKSGATQITFWSGDASSGSATTAADKDGVEYGCDATGTQLPCDGATITVGTVAATPTPVTPTPGPTEAAAATATRVTFDATQEAAHVGAQTGSGPAEATYQALLEATPPNAETATAVAGAIGSLDATALIVAQTVNPALTATAQAKSTALAKRGTPTPAASSGGSGGDSSTNWGLIIGSVAGGVVLVGAVAGGGYWWYRRRQGLP